LRSTDSPPDLHDDSLVQEYLETWTAETARWWVDGVLVRTLHRAGSKRPELWPDEAMYLVLNNGLRTDSPDETTTYPNRLQIDYIEIYTRPEADVMR
jgi:beta-glucanase (GH16 family)